MTHSKKFLIGSLSLLVAAAGARAAGEGLESLLEEKSQIEQAKSKLLTEKRELDDWRKKADEVRADIEATVAELDRRTEAFNQVAAPVYAEVDQWNGQCGGRTLPEPEYNACASWRSRLEPQVNEMSSRRDAIAADANAVQARAAQYVEGEAGLSQAETTWAAQVQEVDRAERAWQLRAAAWRTQQVTALAQRCVDIADPDEQAQCFDRFFDGRRPAEICNQEDLREFKACLDKYVNRG